MGGLCRPYDKCTKTGDNVIDVLQSENPTVRVPNAGDFDAYPHSEEQLTSFPVYCIEDEVSTRASGLPGGTGPSGVDGTHLKNLLLRHKWGSKRLYQEMAEWIELLSNTTPDYAVYRAVNSGHILAADKDPGVRGLSCGKICMRHWSQCNLDQTKGQAMATCQNKQMGTGLKSGIEGNLHAVRAI